MFAGRPFQGLVARQAFAASGRPTQADRGEGRYGDLRPITRTDNATRDTLTLLLPVGFDFVHFGLTGTTMTDGHLTPLGHDGMAAFPGPDGTTRLVRNHEDRNIALLSTPSGSAAKRYDQRGGGGTSTLQVRTLPDGSRVLEKDFMSISGTIVNCAGVRLRGDRGLPARRLPRDAWWARGWRTTATCSRCRRCSTEKSSLYR
jgi:hypothetical protein